MFSSLSPGSPLHVLSLKDGVKYNMYTIDYVSPVRPMYPTYTAGASMGLNMGSVVDITITLDGKKKEFTGVTATGSVSTSTDYIITENKEAMISQVDNLLQSKEQVINNIEQTKADAEECKEILKKLNPTYAKEEAMDSAITELRQRVNNMQQEFGDIRSDMKQMLGILTNGNKTP